MPWPAAGAEGRRGQPVASATRSRTNVAGLRRIAPVVALDLLAGRSIIHNPSRAAARAELVPGARVELWPDASHALNGEFPDRIADRVADLVGSTR